MQSVDPVIFTYPVLAMSLCKALNCIISWRMPSPPSDPQVFTEYT